MKKAHLMTIALAALMSLGGLAGCSKSGGGSGGGGGSSDISFAFSIGIEGDYATLEVGSTYSLNIYDNGVDASGREYTFESDDEDVATINHVGTIQAKKAGDVRFYVSESKSGLNQSLGVSVINPAPTAQGGQNYAGSGAEERTKILGKLEEYAMDSHLTGISLFENGGYVLYSQRAQEIMPTTEYITGYGFGLLADAKEGFKSDLPGISSSDEPAKYARFYHTASSSDPLTINALNASGSQVSDLSSYITSSYFSMRMKSDKSNAEWYPVLADPTAHPVIPDPEDATKTVVKMYHMGDANPTNMYTRWRIYVRTDLQYRYNGGGVDKDGHGFDKRTVALEDYEFILRFLLTGSHKLSRGSEMAADTSYGIKGARSYNDLTKEGKTDSQCKAIWDGLKESGTLGIKTGVCTENSEPYEGSATVFYPAGSYIEFDLLNPLDDFTAMYTLSSSLYSPIPEDFMTMVGRKRATNGGEAAIDGFELSRAAERYGTFNDNNKVPSHLKDNIVESTICLGAYFLETWIEKQKTVFETNTEWFEHAQKRYQIAGVHIVINTHITEDPDAYFNEWKDGKLDSCSVPTKKLNEYRELAYKAEGDSVFKLNVNSSTQEQWDARFGQKGKIKPGHSRTCKPWMSNDNFLNGLFWSIDRKAFAEKRGVEPSINYFSGSYMSDPRNNISYNSTNEHKEAVKKYHNIVNGVDDYGYNKDLAVSYFKAAVAQLVKERKLNYGTVDKPTVISIEIWWMYASDETEYGIDIANYFKEAFNSPSVSNGRVVLEIEQHSVAQWEAVYSEHLQVGMFDLGFGAISGNTYNPLNFLEVLKSDNSSTFTLNWGPDTSAVDEKHPLVYNGQKYSFDALWEVADHGGIVKDGVKQRAVENCYLAWGENASIMNLTELPVKLSFADVGSSVEFEVESVTLYVVGGASYGASNGISFAWTDRSKGEGKIILPASKTEIKNNIITTFKLDDKPVKEKDEVLYKVNYGASKYFVFEITYSLSINGGEATLNSTLAYKDKSNQDTDPSRR